MAHETAVQLQAQGEEVAALVIVDNYPPDAERPAERRVKRAPHAGDADSVSQEHIVGEESDQPGRVLADQNDGLIDWVRQEAGKALGGITEDEILLLARSFDRNTHLMLDHDYSLFDGEALIFVAEIKRKSAAQQGDGNSPVERWRPYISGEISEIRLPCAHLDIFRPDMLAQVWSSISSWLGLQ